MYKLTFLLWPSSLSEVIRAEVWTSLLFILGQAQADHVWEHEGEASAADQGRQGADRQDRGEELDRCCDDPSSYNKN